MTIQELGLVRLAVFPSISSLRETFSLYAVHSSALVLLGGPTRFSPDLIIIELKLEFAVYDGGHNVSGNDWREPDFPKSTRLTPDGHNFNNVMNGHR